MADVSADQGIIIHGVGIGSDWSDRLLDDLASRTGGGVAFLDTPASIDGVMGDIYEKLGRTVASRMRLEGSVAQQVDLRSAFRLLPEPMPMGDSLPMTLGNLPRDGIVRVLLEMVIHPIGKISELTLAHFTIDGDILGKGDDSVPLPLEVRIPVSDEPDTEPPSEEITSLVEPDFTVSHAGESPPRGGAWAVRAGRSSTGKSSDAAACERRAGTCKIGPE